MVVRQAGATAQTLSHHWHRYLYEGITAGTGDCDSIPLSSTTQKGQGILFALALLRGDGW